MKIIIIGNGGTGKSTLADKLGKDLGIPVTHLDLLSWRDNYERVPEEKFVKDLNNVFKNENMIIEGWAYHSTMYERLKWADVIIYLKYPLDVCQQTVFKRNIEYNNKPYPFDPFTGDRNAMNDLYKAALEKVHYEYEPDLREWLKEMEINNKNIFVLNSIEEVNNRYKEISEKIKCL